MSLIEVFIFLPALFHGKTDFFQKCEPLTLAASSGSLWRYSFKTSKHLKNVLKNQKENSKALSLGCWNAFMTYDVFRQTSLCQGVKQSSRQRKPFYTIEKGPSRNLKSFMWCNPSLLYDAKSSILPKQGSGIHHSSLRTSNACLAGHATGSLELDELDFVTF